MALQNKKFIANKFKGTTLIKNKIKIWGAGTVRTLRPIWVAEELSLDYQLYPIGPRTGETQTEEFTDLNPKQKIPFLEHGDIKLSESLTICRYLQNAFPSPKLPSPKDLVSQAKEDEWCSYIYGEIDETTLYVMRRHYDLTDIYGEAPIAVEACRDYLKRQFSVIDKHLKKNENLLKEGFSLADVILVSCLDWAIFYKFKLPGNIMSYRNRIIKRPAYLKARDINYNSVKGDS
tara:strand:+ start:508 stop:1206 length:699 start_codon:yes stop_codon:yes gene_type:complete